MKFKYLILSAFFFLLGCYENNTDSYNTDEINKLEKKSKLRHLVLLKFKESSSSEDIKKIEIEFSKLSSKISEIKDFEWGLNNSPEGLNKGFTHGFMLTFDSTEGREIYLPHPNHLEFVSLLKPYLEDVLVLDYWSR